MGSLKIFMVILDINWGQLNEYPFNAQVWGTASDWIMIFVTLGTAVLLIRTLQEQRNANRILGNADRRKVQPRFQIADVDYLRSGVKVKLKDNPAFDINVLSSNESLSLLFFSKELLAEEEDSIFCKLISDPRVFLEEEIIIMFKDIDGNQYSQVLSNLTLIPTITFPEYHPNRIGKGI